jgi:hypothetical protein
MTHWAWPMFPGSQAGRSISNEALGQAAMRRRWLLAKGVVRALSIFLDTDGAFRWQISE